MPYDANGNYTLPTSYFVENGDTVLPIQHNPPFEDVAQALSSVLLRSGAAPMGGALNMATNKISNVGDATLVGDAVNKGQLDAVSSALGAKYVVKTANYTALDSDVATTFRFTTAATLSFDVSANLRTNWRIEVWNDTSGVVIIDPDGTDTINGAATAVLRPGQRAEIFKTSATTFQASIVGNAQLTPDFVRGLILSNNAGNPNTHIDISAGSAKLGLLIVTNGGTFTKRLNGTWAVGSGNGGLDTGGTSPGATYHVHSLRKQSDGSFDAVYSLSASAPNMALLTGYDVIQRVGSVVLDGSGNIRPFTQTLSRFALTTFVTELTETSLQALSAITLSSVPAGIPVRPILSATLTMSSATSLSGYTLGITDGSNVTAGGIIDLLTDVNTTNNTTGSAATEIILTNTARQIGRRTAAVGNNPVGPTFTLRCYGWTDITIPRNEQ